MAGTALAAVGSAVAGKVAGKVLGGGDTASGAAAPPPMLFKAGGLSSSINDEGQLTIGSSKARKALLERIKQSYGDQAGVIRGELAPRFETAYNNGLASVDSLISQVSPGVGRLTDARMQGLDNARERTISNLSENLARRRISGSSFGQNSLVSAENEFAQQEAELRAESFLEELEITNQLEQQKLQIGTSAAEQAYQFVLDAYTLDRAGDQVDLDEMNKQQEIATSLLSGVQQQLNRNADLAVNDIKSKNALAGDIVGNIDFGQIIGMMSGGA